MGFLIVCFDIHRFYYTSQKRSKGVLRYKVMGIIDDKMIADHTPLKCYPDDNFDRWAKSVLKGYSVYCLNPCFTNPSKTPGITVA